MSPPCCACAATALSACVHTRGNSGFTREERHSSASVARAFAARRAGACDPVRMRARPLAPRASTICARAAAAQQRAPGAARECRMGRAAGPRARGAGTAVQYCSYVCTSERARALERLAPPAWILSRTRLSEYYYSCI